MHWFVLHSKPRKEDFLFGQLSAHGIEAFYPRLYTQTAISHVRKMKPYFPGYLFVHLDAEDPRLSNFRWMLGAKNLVNFGGDNAIVQDGIIHTIQQRVEKINLSHTEFIDSLRRGDRVLFFDGAFSGYEAIFDVHLSGTERVRVLFTLMNKRQIPLIVPRSCLRHRKSYQS